MMYDIIVFENLGFLPQLIEKPTFLKISPLESVFEKMRFVLQTGENNIRFQTKNGYVWRGLKSLIWNVEHWYQINITLDNILSFN